MLRTLIVAFALAVPSLAAAEEPQQFPQSAIGIEVRADDGTVVGHVDAVERDGRGRIRSAEISGLEPGDAPAASSDLVARNERGEVLFVTDRRPARSSGGERTQTR